MPAEPAPGATLHADATTLLPLRAGSVWHYRGQHDLNANRHSYGALVRLSGVADGVAAQRQSTAPDDNDTFTYFVAGSNIMAREVLDLGGSAAAQEVTYTLLRSPVRQNEQITLFDRAALDFGVDVDGDRVNDSADIAAYSRVAGNEQVELPDVQRTLTALRVDVVLMLRFKKSSDGQYLPVSRVLVSEWFAPGIGIVRRSATVATTDGTAGPLDSDERLVYWDGLTEGLGALPPTRVAPSPSVVLRRPWSARRVGDRAFVATAPDNGSVFQGLILTVLDQRGAVVASRTDPTLPLVGESMPLLALGSSVGVFSSENAGIAESHDLVTLRLRRFDRNAQPVGDPQGVVVSGALSGSAAAASDGQNLWVLWADFDVPSRRMRLWLRSFQADGQPAAAAQLLTSQVFAGPALRVYSRLALDAADGRLLASWVDGSDLFADPRASYALSVGGGAPLVRSLGTVAGPSTARLMPVVSGQRQALAWSGALGFAGRSNGNDYLLRAVALGDDAAPRLTAATPDGELLTSGAGPIGSAMSTGAVAADGLAFIAAVDRYERMLPAYDISALDFVELNSWQGNAALAASAPQSRRLRLRHVGFSNADDFGSLHFVLPFEDRLLLLGSNNIGLTSAVVFKR